mgnify:CR=1 FL=1
MTTQLVHTRADLRSIGPGTHSPTASSSEVGIPA